MKRILLIAVLIVSVGIINVNAQFLKDLKDRALDRTKEVVIGKTADKAADKAGQAADKVLNLDFGNMGKRIGNKVNADDLPKEYYFDYLYGLKMSTSEGEIFFNFFMNTKESGFMGISNSVAMNLFMVMDEERKTSITYMNMDNNRFAMAMQNLEEVEASDEVSYLNEYTITELPNKEFLGYDCIGRQFESDENTMVVYVAPNTKVSLPNAFKSEGAEVPPAFKASAAYFENGLMMYMEMVDKKNKGKKNTSATMECISLETADLMIENRNYRFQ